MFAGGAGVAQTLVTITGTIPAAQTPRSRVWPPTVVTLRLVEAAPRRSTIPALGRSAVSLGVTTAALPNTWNLSCIMLVLVCRFCRLLQRVYPAIVHKDT